MEALKNNRKPQLVRDDSKSVSHRKERGAATPLEPLVRYLDTLAVDNFFGKVVVSFQNGKVQDVKTEQTHKLHEL